MGGGTVLAASAGAGAAATGKVCGCEHAVSNAIAVAGRRRRQEWAGFMAQSMPSISRRDSAYSAKVVTESPASV
jgi:hypothetical protein